MVCVYMLVWVVDVGVANQQITGPLPLCRAAGVGGTGGKSFRNQRGKRRRRRRRRSSVSLACLRYASSVRTCAAASVNIMHMHLRPPTTLVVCMQGPPKRVEIHWSRLALSPIELWCSMLSSSIMRIHGFAHIYRSYPPWRSLHIQKLSSTG